MADRYRIPLDPDEVPAFTAELKRLRAPADPAVPVDRPALDLDDVMGEIANGRVWRTVKALVAEVARLRAEKVRGDDATRDCIRDLRSEVERLRAELADHHCDCLAGKIAEVRAERDRLAAQVQAVETLCDEDWHRAMPGYVLVRQVRAALAVPAATEETDR